MLTNQKANCVAKLADFGLAETLSETKSKRAGTVGYVAPEILAMKPYGTASDIWSLGCLLYAMLTVTLPFNAYKKAQVDYQEHDNDSERQLHVI